jgi:enoyl-CoA hydratase
MADAPVISQEPLFSSAVLSFTATGSVGLIRLNRPQARNAVNSSVASGLEQCIDLLEAANNLQVAVLAGAPPVFCAGADLKEIAQGNAPSLVTARGGFAGFVRRERGKPVIAAVDGAALAGGMEIVLACDLVVAAEGATFGLPEVKRSLAAAAGGLFRVGRRIPLNLAMELALTGDPMTAARAHALGLVNVLCADGQAQDTALALAGRIAANAPLAIRQARKIVAVSPYITETEGWRLSAEAERALMGSGDQVEGVRAFIEKRPPNWAGR